jgi:hypothetical protein
MDGVARAMHRCTEQLLTQQNKRANFCHRANTRNGQQMLEQVVSKSVFRSSRALRVETRVEEENSGMF